MSDKVTVETPESTTPAVVDTKSPEAPKVEQFVPNSRQAVEDRVIVENETFPEESVEEPNPEAKSEEPKSIEAEIDKTPFDKIKEKVQRRIDKEVGKRKSLEEELAQTRSELEQVKAQIKPKPEITEDAKRDPTDAECRAALIKAKQDGNIELEADIQIYISERKAKAERADAEKQMAQRQTEAQAEQAKLQSDWQNLALDYAIYTSDGKLDKTSDMHLDNREGLLYKTAVSLYQDKELQSSHYADPDKMNGFRRAVADAYRAISENKLLPKKELSQHESDSGEAPPSKVDLRKRTQLAEPGSEVLDSPSGYKNLSDTEKVIDEIKMRRKFHQERARV